MREREGERECERVLGGDSLSELDRERVCQSDIKERVYQREIKEEIG